MQPESRSRFLGDPRGGTGGGTLGFKEDIPPPDPEVLLATVTVLAAEDGILCLTGGGRTELLLPFDCDIIVGVALAELILPPLVVPVVTPHMLGRVLEVAVLCGAV